MTAARRTLACVAVLAAFSVGLSGCKYGAALSKREWVVIFKPAATQAQHQEVLVACSGLPNVVPEPMGTGTLVSERMSNVRFRVDKASDGDLARLSVCLGQPKFASVVQSYDQTDTAH